jgi:AmmeMemoRadiSam system protein B
MLHGFPYPCRFIPTQLARQRAALYSADGISNGGEVMHVRHAAVAGSFYPANPDVLRRNVEEMLDSSKPPDVTSCVGLLAPHAGYVYSGNIAAAAYATVRKLNYDAAVVVGPSHRQLINGSALLAEGAYETPLGTLPVDVELACAIESGAETVLADSELHGGLREQGEHSIEVQLPFLQISVGEIPFVPILMGDQKPKHAKELGQAIAGAVGERKVLLVASSDLSHFHSYREAVALDEGVREAVRAFDPLLLYSNMVNDGAEACGAGPMAAVMFAAQQLGAESALELAYATSGDVPGAEQSSVVGYLSAIFVGDGA